MKFYLKNSKRSGSTSLIMLTYYDSQFSDGRFVYSTKEHIDPDNWIPPVKGLKGSTGKAKKGYEHINTRLAEISSQIQRYVSLNRNALTKEGLQEYLDGGRPKEVLLIKPKNLLEEWAEYLEIVKGNVTPRTHKNYQKSYEVMQDFLKLKKLSNILPQQFDFRLLQRFTAYLKERYPSKNTVSKRLKHFKMVLNQGVKIGMNAADIKFKETAGLKISLTSHELEQLINLKLTGKLADVRLLLVIQCSTGVRISDLFRLDKNMQGGSFVFEQAKTGKLTSIPITTPIKNLLDGRGGKLPRMSSYHYNKGIKDLYKMLDSKTTIQVREGDEFKNIPKWKLISSHDAVRTFITLSAEKGMPIDSIATITGKTVAILLKNYLVPSQERAEREMREKWSGVHNVSAPLKIAV